MKKSIYIIAFMSLFFSCKEKEEPTEPVFNEIKSVYIGTTHSIAVDLEPNKGYVQTDSFYSDTIRVRETKDSVFMSNFMSGFKRNDTSLYIVRLPRYSSIFFRFTKPDSLEARFLTYGQCACPWKRETIFKGRKK